MSEFSEVELEAAREVKYSRLYDSWTEEELQTELERLELEELAKDINDMISGAKTAEEIIEENRRAEQVYKEA